MNLSFWTSLSPNCIGFDQKYVTLSVYFIYAIVVNGLIINAFKLQKLLEFWIPFSTLIRSQFQLQSFDWYIFQLQLVNWFTISIPINWLIYFSISINWFPCPIKLQSIIEISDKYWWMTMILLKVLYYRLGSIGMRAFYQLSYHLLFNSNISSSCKVNKWK